MNFLLSHNLYCNNIVLYIVDCKWLEWSAWSDCTKTCGGGTQFREREKIPAEHGGRDCVGENREDRTCNNQICLGIYCSLFVQKELLFAK